MEIQSQKQNADYTWVLGLRNSHDKMWRFTIFAVKGDGGGSLRRAWRVDAKPTPSIV